MRQDENRVVRGLMRAVLSFALILLSPGLECYASAGFALGVRRAMPAQLPVVLPQATRAMLRQDGLAWTPNMTVPPAVLHDSAASLLMDVQAKNEKDPETGPELFNRFYDGGSDREAGSAVVGSVGEGEDNPLSGLQGAASRPGLSKTERSSAINVMVAGAQPLNGWQRFVRLSRSHPARTFFIAAAAAALAAIPMAAAGTIPVWSATASIGVAGILPQNGDA
jgi:hypothetical protein